MNKRLNILDPKRYKAAWLRILIILTILVCSNGLFAQLTQHELRAAHVVTFRRFIEWQKTDAKKPYIVCIWGDDDEIAIPLGSMLNQKFGADSYSISCSHDIASLKKDLNIISVLYISEVYDNAELRTILDLARKKKNILTVGNNIKNFCAQGGIINIASPSAKKRFVINKEEATEAHFFISSKLYDLAEFQTTKR